MPLIDYGSSQQRRASASDSQRAHGMRTPREPPGCGAEARWPRLAPWRALTDDSDGQLGCRVECVGGIKQAGRSAAASSRRVARIRNPSFSSIDTLEQPCRATRQLRPFSFPFWELQPSRCSTLWQQRQVRHLYSVLFVKH